MPHYTTDRRYAADGGLRGRYVFGLEGRDGVAFFPGDFATTDVPLWQEFSGLEDGELVCVTRPRHPHAVPDEEVFVIGPDQRPGHFGAMVVRPTNGRSNAFSVPVEWLRKTGLAAWERELLGLPLAS